MCTDQKICITFSYDGTKYNGSALQKYNERTVTQDLINALEKAKIYVENPVFAGRTDKGVSASNMVASMMVKKIERMNYAAVMQKYMPNDIVINAYALVHSEFDARHDCIERHYKYVFANKYDMARMNKCCQTIMQYNTYKNICKRSEERSLRNKGKQIDDAYYNRKINYIAVTSIDDNFCVLDIKGRSFLHNMVRKIFWIVKNYALQKIDDDWLDKIQTNDLNCGTEAPDNLIFYKASYKHDIEWIENDKKILREIYETKRLEFELIKLKLK